MDDVKFYIGCYLDGRESVFYWKSATKLYDLIGKCGIAISDVDYDSLIPYNSVLKQTKDEKKMIINDYFIDRKKGIILERLFIGPIFQITDITTKITSHNNGRKLVVNTESTCDVSEYKPVRLLYASNPDSLEYSDFTDLEDSKRYNHLSEGYKNQLYVNISKIKLFSDKIKLDKDNIIMEKGKVLEKFRKWRNR